MAPDGEDDGLVLAAVDARGSSTSRSPMSTVTSVPGFQYVFGRKSSRSLPNQWPTASTTGSDVTRMAFSTAARSATGRLKAKETIMPVPTVDRFSGLK